MKLTEKMSYLRGLADGLEFDKTTSEGKIIDKLLEVLQETVLYIDDLQNQVDELTELCDSLDEDLGDVEQYLLDEEDDEYEDEDDDDDDYDFDDDEEEELYETVCPTCNNTIVLADSILDEGNMKCPCCGELLEFDFDEISIEDFEDDAEDAE